MKMLYGCLFEKIHFLSNSGFGRDRGTSWKKFNNDTFIALQMKAKLEMYFAQPSFCIFEWCVWGTIGTKELISNHYNICFSFIVCQDSPCLNGGTCNVNTTQPWKIVCKCLTGFRGKYCQICNGNWLHNNIII